MNIRVLVSLAMLVGIGTVLHTVVPPFLFGMKPDMLLTMMFLGIMLFPEKKSVFVLALATGIVSALTTSFPAGQLPNIIDKLVTAFAVLGLYAVLRNLKSSTVSAGVVTVIGTLISGTVFLSAALLIVGLPGGATFLPLFIGVVLPATALNTVFMVIVYPIVQSITRRANLTLEV